VAVKANKTLNECTKQKNAAMTKSNKEPKVMKTKYSAKWSSKNQAA